MSLHPDLSDSALLDAFDDVRNESSSTNWVLYGYVPKTDKIKVDSTGTGGLSEMSDEMSDGRVNYGFIRYNVNGTWKYVYIAWCGDGVTGIRKGSFASHAVDMGKFLDGFAVQINARNEDDLDETKILARLKTATGSHGRRNEKAKVQGTTGVDNTPKQAAPKRDAGEDLKAQSTAFWEQQRAEEAEEKQRKEDGQRNRNAPAPSGGRNMGKQWEQKQQQQQEAPPPQRAPAAGGGGAARIAASFNNPPAQAPPPKVAAPPPKAPAAAPPPAVEEDWGSAPAQEESTGYEEQQPYDEGEQYHEEPQYEEHHEEQQYEEHHEEQPEEYAGGEEHAGGGGAGQCRALYDYQGENEGDLSFAEGDIINLIDQSNPDGWWEGEINGRQGFFPSNFVQGI